ncbi:MBL fold metallo-hydrolase [Nevskia ramosa]|uniref:MBL fold metallo-hydrolase n=1 Tax=Nevskia ramosa TaxID=64002 RepID=UPI00146DF63C|nr:MBL fold metallo-hydrolase [Nevskia ramosa]
MAAIEEDASATGEYHFLDVGRTKYGECILVRFGDTSVLIDGSHSGDFKGQKGTESIPDQLKAIFNRPPPYDIALLVVTHCHADHIGCLPELVTEGVIRPRWALITDHRAGFGRSIENANTSDLADAATQALAAVLREEDASDLSNRELADFIQDASTVEPRYAKMIEDLVSTGVQVIEYAGDPLPAALVAELKPTKMELLGPSLDQLVLAADQISNTNEDAVDAVRSELAADSSLDSVRLYRKIVQQSRFSDPRNPRGSGMNCQSITLAFGPTSARVLLAGDMQFAAPDVRGLDSEIADLRERVKKAGPYKVFKTTHHTSWNGQDEMFLADLGDPEIIVHSGGSRDSSHPDAETLDMLKQRKDLITFARTDRNGRIVVRPHRKDQTAVEVSRGKVNNFDPNVLDDEPIEITTPVVAPIQVAAALPTEVGQGAQIIIVNLPQTPIHLTIAGIEIISHGGPSAGKVVARPRPGDEPSERRPVQRNSEPSHGNIVLSRKLPKLLFVTHSERLAANIGREEAKLALDAIRVAGQQLCDLARVSGDPEAAAIKMLQQDPIIKGVVIAGGYDVVPSSIIDVLPSEVRQALDSAADDLDNYVVWSDDGYADLDGDRLPELPVSRIPDAHDSALFLTALTARPVDPSSRFGIRNVKRPFADKVWKALSGSAKLKVSEMFLAGEILPLDLAANCHYLMLHGAEDDATRFTGERQNGNGTIAFTIDSVPRSFEGVAFAGCCWGALTVSEKASEAEHKDLPTPRLAGRSIALSYLKAGANAFVGCTGSHYSGENASPTVNPALPLHLAFWQHLAAQKGPAAALFAARQDYGKLIAQNMGRLEPSALAYRLKNRAQFTCLGLGW